MATDASSLSSCHHVKVVIEDISAQSILIPLHHTPNLPDATDTSSQQGTRKGMACGVAGVKDGLRTEYLR